MALSSSYCWKLEVAWLESLDPFTKARSGGTAWGTSKLSRKVARKDLGISCKLYCWNAEACFLFLLLLWREVWLDGAAPALEAPLTLASVSVFRPRSRGCMPREACSGCCDGKRSTSLGCDELSGVRSGRWFLPMSRGPPSSDQAVRIAEDVAAEAARLSPRAAPRTAASTSARAMRSGFSSGASVAILAVTKGGYGNVYKCANNERA